MNAADQESRVGTASRASKTTAPSSFQSHLDSDGTLQIVLSGNLDTQTTGSLVRQTQAALTTATGVSIDASGVEYCDMAGVAYLLELRRRQEAAGSRFKLTGLKEEFSRLLQLFDADELFQAEAAQAVRVPLVEQIGRRTMDAIRSASDMVGFLGEVTVSCVRSVMRRQKVRWSDTFLVAEAAGVRALPVISLMGLILGLIVAFQGAIPLKRYGGEVLVADMVILAMFREMGPLFTAIILAARSSSAFAAELGTMKINEEVDALKTMGLDPVPFLVMPRILAGVLVAPLLTVVTNIMGLVGGGIVFLFMGFTSTTYMERLLLRGRAGDFVGGLFRALVFGVLIAGIGCLQGLRTGRGARAVGASTTGAVVSSIVAIILADGLLAVVYYKLGF
jgi:phospholipid/cholesterol/gamma-HCH transport system permease protein